MGLKSKINRDDLYLLKVINMEYINLDKSYIGDDGAVRFNIDVDKLPDKDSKTAREILNNNLFDSAFNYAYCHGRSLQKDYEPDDTTEYYIMYDPTPTAGFLSTELFDIRHGLTHCKAYDFVVGETMRNLQLVDTNSYEEIQESLDKFNAEAYKWTRKIIRETLFDSTAVGEFHKDYIREHTYIQQRKYRGSYAHYILWRWWEYNFPDEITWEEFGDNNNIFIALNDDFDNDIYNEDDD